MADAEKTKSSKASKAKAVDVAGKKAVPEAGAEHRAAETPDVEENPQALVPLSQAMHASPMPIDPTGGKIYDALDIAADKVEIENVPVREALDEACRTAQKALDEAVR